MYTKQTISLLITVLMLALTPSLRAQGIPDVPNTTFALYCYEVNGIETTYHFGYTSTGGERFYGSGFDFITKAGTYPDAFTATPLAYDPFPALGLASVSLDPDPDTTHAVVTQIVLSKAAILPCDLMKDIALLPTPAPTPCPHTAINGATGQPYCFEPLAGGLVPLPEPMNQQAS